MNYVFKTNQYILSRAAFKRKRLWDALIYCFIILLLSLLFNYGINRKYHNILCISNYELTENIRNVFCSLSAHSVLQYSFYPLYALFENSLQEERLQCSKWGKTNLKDSKTIKINQNRIPASDSTPWNIPSNLNRRDVREKIRVYYK